MLYVKTKVADPHHFNADPDPTFLVNAEPDTVFNFHTDPNSAPHLSNRNLRPLIYRPFRAPFFRLQASEFRL
jgi:hypothetical protein